MAFDVLITDEAFNDLDAITDFITSQASIEIARRWFAEMIGSRKNRAYKVCFTIHQKTPLSGSVRAFHVRHWAMRPLDTEEMKDLLT